MIPRTWKDQKKEREKQRKDRCFVIFKHVKFCMEKAKGIGSVRGGGKRKKVIKGLEDFDYYY